MRRRRSPPFPISCRPTAKCADKAFAALRRVLSAAGEITGEAAQRLRRVAGLFDVKAEPAAAADAIVALKRPAKAS